MRDEKGFVLIEVLMEGLALTALAAITVVIGIQSAVAVSSVAESRAEAYVEAMRLDLNNLAARQALHYADELSYSESQSALNFEAAKGVSVSIHATRHGWSATARHASLAEGVGCEIRVGPRHPSEQPGSPADQVVCTDE